MAILLSATVTTAVIIVMPAAVSAVCNYGEACEGWDPGCFEWCDTVSQLYGSYWDPQCGPRCNHYICWYYDQPYCGLCGNDDYWVCGV